MGSRRVLAIAFASLMCVPALAQGPTFGIGRTPTAEELRAPFATTVWDYINRGMPLNREGTLTPDEVYALTAYLLFINGVIPEDQVLDQQNLAKVKMPL